MCVRVHVRMCACVCVCVCVCVCCRVQKRFTGHRVHDQYPTSVVFALLGTHHASAAAGECMVAPDAHPHLLKAFSHK